MTKKKIKSEPITFADSLPTLDPKLVDEVSRKTPAPKNTSSAYSERSQERYAASIHSDARQKVNIGALEWAKETGEKPVKMSKIVRAMFAAVADNFEHLEQCSTEEEVYNAVCKLLKS